MEPVMRRVRSLWWVGLAAVLAATVIVLVGTRPGGTTAAAPAPPPAAQPPAAPSAAPPPAVEVAFRYLPLWPFDSVADAAEWQKEANPGGHQPWSATVPFAAADGTVRTLVVSTASHINEGIGRFAITGVRVG